MVLGVTLTRVEPLSSHDFSFRVDRIDLGLLGMG
jgi:hypothetical protein